VCLQSSSLWGGGGGIAGTAYTTWLCAGPLTCSSRFWQALDCCGELAIFSSSSYTRFCAVAALLLSAATMPCRLPSTASQRRAELAMVLLSVVDCA
jgi:hypothetical protein